MTFATIGFIFGLVFAAWYVKRHVGFHLSVTFLLFASLIIVHGIPLLIYLNITGPDTFIYEAALAPVDRDEVQARLLWALALMFVFVVMGSALARLAFPGWHRQGLRALSLESEQALHRSLRWTALSKVTLWLVVAAMLTVSVYQSQLSKVIEYFTSGGSEIEMILFRRDSGGTPFYVYNVVLYSVAPFLVMVAYCADQNQSKRRGVSVLVIAMLTAVLLGKFGMLSKAPPVIFLLQLLLLRALLRRQRVNLRLFGLMVGAALTLFLIMVRLTIPDIDLGSGLAFIYYRVFDIPNEGLLEYFSAVPATLPHGLGTGLFAFLGGVSNADRLPTYTAVAEIARGSVLATSNAMFIADAWAEFAWVGVVSFSVLAGFIVRVIDLYAFRHGHSDESACLVAGCAFGVFTMLSTALTTAMLSGGLALLPLLSFAFSERRRRRDSDRLIHSSSMEHASAR